MDNFSKPCQPHPPLAGANGTQSIAELTAEHPGVPMIKLGKQAIKDAGQRMAQIQGLKPGGSSIRTAEIIEEMLRRLLIGETVTSICCDVHMPASSTLWLWCRDDEKLEADIKMGAVYGPAHPCRPSPRHRSG
ncbi:MAG: hypothetical protein EOO38_28105, partial [Cytophagaceae bacterium]